MDEKSLGKFKTLLESQRREILGRQEKIRKESVDALPPEPTGDEGDEARHFQEQHLAIRFGERERAMLAKLDAALGRIKEGSFGLCSACDQKIEIKRLEARPVAELCVKCKEEEERREKAFA